MSTTYTRGLGFLFLALVFPATTAAQGLRAYLDSIDLNDYSLGLNFYYSDPAFAGVDDLKIAYPAPTTFGHPLLDDDPLFIHGSSIGLRKFNDAGFNWGGFAKIQTLGYGSNESEALLGMRRRSWTIEGGLLVGTRLGPVRADVLASADMANEHNGYEVALQVAWPFGGDTHIVVPELKLNYQSDKLLNHYFGVRPDEALPGRPAYLPGAATTITGSLEWSWRFSRRWYLDTTVSVDLLPDEVTNSPVVDEDTSWRFNIGLAYDGQSFVEPGAPGSLSASHVELGVGAFFINAESNMDFRADNGTTADIEDALGMDDRAVSVPVELIWHKGRFHRFDLSYFQLNRSSSSEILADLALDGTTFAAGETVTTDFDTRVLRFGYGFALLRDEQKDLSLFGGLHVTDIDYRVRGSTSAIAASTTAFLPVIGARLRANLTERLMALTNLELFELDFDQHSGELIDFSIAGRYLIGQRFFVDAGYRFYRQDIDSGDDSFLGDYRFVYRGLFASLRVRF